MSMVKEFKEFAMKGNVMDMAVGIIIGGAFGKIISSLVGDVLMPLIGLVTGGIDFTQMYANLSGNERQSLAAAKDAGDSVVLYGQFIQNVFDFVIVAFAIFMMIRFMNNLRRKEEQAPAKPSEPPEDIVLLREIRDNLKG